MAIALLAAQESSFSSVFVWSLVLVAAVIGGFWVVTWLKRWLKTDDEPVSIGFSLSDLRDLHRAGKLSDEEFERAVGVVGLRQGHGRERLAVLSQNWRRRQGAGPRAPPGRPGRRVRADNACRAR